MLDRVAERAAAAVAGRGVALHLDHRHRGDERLGVARCGFMYSTGLPLVPEGAHGRLGPRAAAASRRLAAAGPAPAGPAADGLLGGHFPFCAGELRAAAPGVARAAAARERFLELLAAGGRTAVHGL